MQKQVFKKMLGLKLQDVRGYYEKMLTATAEQLKAFSDLETQAGKLDFRIQEGVAIIPVRGIISQYNDFWTWFFSGVSTEQIEAQFDSALNDVSVKGIIFDIDSPGGEIGGINDLSNKIFQSRGSKPIVSYVSDQAASAGYWIGAACGTVISGQVAILGSIGVVASFSGEESKTIDFFSSVSPNKNIKANDPEGAQQIQKWVDDIGAVFVDRVAAFRGVNTEHVLNNFGKGDVMIAGNALTVGMIDTVGNFKTALQIAGGQQLEQTATGRKAGALSANKSKNNNDKIKGKEIKEKGKIKTMKNKIFAKIKNGLRAELVVVDTDNEDAVIPDDAIALSDLDVPWLEQNLPELVEEIKQMGRDEENGRQEELDDMEPGETEDESETQAIIKKARRDTKVKASDIAVKLVKAMKNQKPKVGNDNSNDKPVPPLKPKGEGDAKTQAVKDLEEFKSGIAFSQKKKIKLGAVA